MSRSGKIAKKKRSVHTEERRPTTARKKASSLFPSGLGALVPAKRTTRDEPEGVAIRVSRTERTLTTIQPIEPSDRDPVAATADLHLHRGHGAPAENSRGDLNSEPSSSHRFLAILAFALLIGGVAVLSMGELKTQKGRQQAPTSKNNRADWEKRVDFHRMQTGTRLNNQRMAVEMDNYRTAPPLDLSDHKGAEQSILTGVPLAAEPHHRKSSRDRLAPLNPDYADARVKYGIQEQIDANEWEERAQQEFVEDFVANAAREGYKVKVHKDGTVDVLRAPAEGPYGAGSSH